MAVEAERLLEGSGWLPEVLRTQNFDAPTIETTPAQIGEETSAESDDFPAFLAEGEAEPMVPEADE